MTAILLLAMDEMLLEALRLAGVELEALPPYLTHEQRFEEIARDSILWPHTEMTEM